MEIISNFSLAYCFISFILGAIFMLTTFCIAAMGKVKEPRNNVHFYVARDKNNELGLWFGKPYRGIENWICVGYSVIIASGDRELNLCRLNIEDYDNLKWEDEPLEVFLNLED